MAAMFSDWLDCVELYIFLDAEFELETLEFLRSFLPSHKTPQTSIEPAHHGISPIFLSLPRNNSLLHYYTPITLLHPYYTNTPYYTPITLLHPITPLLHYYSPITLLHPITPQGLKFTFLPGSTGAPSFKF